VAYAYIGALFHPCGRLRNARSWIGTGEWRALKSGCGAFRPRQRDTDATQRVRRGDFQLKRYRDRQLPRERDLTEDKPARRRIRELTSTMSNIIRGLKIAIAGDHKTRVSHRITNIIVWITKEATSRSWL